MTTWDRYDGLASVVMALLSSGLSGFSSVHSDIGGYTMVYQVGGLIRILRTRELMQRWIEMSAFSDAVFRTHEGNLPDYGCQVYDDGEIANFFAHFAKVHAALWSYRQQLLEEAVQKGTPLVRALFLHYPSDPVTLTLERQFMLGTEYIVCPVLQEGERSVECYLPAGSGNWVHLWDCDMPLQETKDDSGKWVECSAELRFPCVFYKEGSEEAARFVKEMRDKNVYPVLLTEGIRQCGLPMGKNTETSP